MDIDTTGFELGMPTKLEMLEQQCLLLVAECEDARAALAKAKNDLGRMIAMHAEAMRGRKMAERSMREAEHRARSMAEQNYILENLRDEQEQQIKLLRHQIHGVERR